MTIQATVVDTTQLIDHKRTLWPFALCWLSMPALGCYVAVTTKISIFYWLVPIIWFVVVPILDCVLPCDSGRSKRVRSVELDLKFDYSRLIVLAVPIAYATLIGCASLIAEIHGQPSALVGTGLSLGIVFWILITLSHAYARHESRMHDILSFFATAIVGFAHCRYAHCIAHQETCATPADHSSARMGENLYRFILRSLRGSIEQAWVSEKRRLANAGPIKALFRNEVVRGLTFSIALHGSLIAVLGFAIAPALIIAIVSAWFFHSAMSYVQHYGLLREKHEDGTYVNCSSSHAWDSTHAASTLLLFNTTRYAETHSYSDRRFQSTGVDNNAPKLPFGFAATLVLAMLPWLWFRTMDPAVARWARGDLQNVNIDGGAYADLMERHHRPDA